LKIHLEDFYEDSKVPYWNASKKQGYSIAICGYQRKYTTAKIEEVTCKICLKEINKRK
jgi:hypothetical protein